MTTISGRQPSVAIEYDCRGSRATKVFTSDNAYKARSFYSKKLIAGKNPKVKGVE
jgi:hypothetical protein